MRSLHRGAARLPDPARRGDRRRRSRHEHEPRVHRRRGQDGRPRRRHPAGPRAHAGRARRWSRPSAARAARCGARPCAGRARRSATPRRSTRAQLVDGPSRPPSTASSSWGPPSRATRRSSTRSARRSPPCSAAVEQGTPLAAALDGGPHRGRGGHARDHADAGPQGPGVVPRRALGRPSGPRRHVDDADRRRPRTHGGGGIVTARVLRGTPASPGAAIGPAWTRLGCGRQRRRPAARGGGRARTPRTRPGRRGAGRARPHADARTATRATPRSSRPTA